MAGMANSEISRLEVRTLIYLYYCYILAYDEAKLNSRIRNMFGYILVFISTLLVITVSPIR